MTEAPGTIRDEGATERRRTPRSRVDLPVRLKLPPGLGQAAGAADTAAAQIVDLSLSGIRCVTGRPLGVMTQIGVLLVLPSADTAIDCRGAVVRSRKVKDVPEGALYETAIFFTSMSEPDRVELQEFLAGLREQA